MTDKQIEILENYVKSKGKGLFEDVKITISEYSEVTVGIYINWDYFPENHGVYKLKDSYLTKLRESIKTFFKMSDISEHKFWFIDIVIMNNFDESSPEEPLNEIERDWRDEKYSNEYPKFRDRMSPILDKMIESYYKDSKGNISLFAYGEKEKILLNYVSKSQDMYYDNSLTTYFTEYLPVYMWSRHGKYLMYDYFKSQFPDVIVKDVYSANISRG